MKSDKHDLDALFALARDEPTELSPSFTERLLADAVRELPREPVETVQPKIPRQTVFGFGWLPSVSLVAFAAIGLAVGLLNPTLSESLYSDSDLLTSLMPDPSIDLWGDIEG